MTHPTYILNWLKIGLEQSTGSLTENFYYDKRDNEFFSIMAVDYFMLDEDLNISNDVTTSYSKIQENSLIDRIQRIENNDPDIISIPRVSLEDRKAFMRKFVQALPGRKLDNLLYEQIQNQDYRTKFDFYFGNEIDETTKQHWEDEKANFLHEQVAIFLHLNNINIETASFWDVEAKGSISIDLTKEDKQDSLPTNLEEPKL